MTPHTSPLSDQFDSETDSGDVDAIALLVADHEEVKELFIEYQELGSGDGLDEERAELAALICEALTVHATLEEEIFYPAARDALDNPGLIEDAEHDHAQARALIEQLQGMEPTDDQFDNTLQQLQEAVDLHVQEEEDELFALVRESSIDLLAVGLQMADRRDELLTRPEQEGTED